MFTSSLIEPVFYMSNLVDLCRKRAQEHPGQTGYVFLKNGETEEGSITYAVLDRRARLIGAWLQSKNAIGERAVLMYPQGLEFICAYFGCLYAGVVAVPAYPPHPMRPISRLMAIVKDSQAAFALTTASIYAAMQQRIADTPQLSAMQWHTTDNLESESDVKWRKPVLNGKTLAFLQYTSGSTGLPKGVMVTHGNLLWTIADLDRGWGHSSSSTMVAWLPTFHDLGLIYGVLLPIYRRFPCYLMDPFSFLKRPMRWLEAISRYKATHSFAPNFAYELCIRKSTPEQRSSLDLSNWRMALNAAEPLREKTLVRFSEAFKPGGFRYSSFCPGYGLAEAAVKVSALPVGGIPTLLKIDSDALSRNMIIEAAPDDPNAQVMIGCGRSQIGAKIIIVDPDSFVECPEGQVGEIWVWGLSVAQGYWRRPEETKQTFCAFLSDSDEGPFLRTGDLGFLKDQELFITGRLKDLIIIRGQNHYPQDIELTVEKSHEALKPGCGAAFTVEVNEEERLVVVFAVKPRLIDKLDVDKVLEVVRRAITEEHALQAEALVLVRPKKIFKTSSGKIQRRACRSAFLKGHLGADVVGQWRRPPAVDPEKHITEDYRRNGRKEVRVLMMRSVEAIETWLRDRLARHLRVSASRIGLREPFAVFGVDSKDAAGFTGELEQILGRRLAPTIFYDYPTIHDLARQLAASVENIRAACPVPSGHRDGKDALAIIGMGCRFPGADNPEAFWQLLIEKKDAIKKVPSDRWDADEFYDSTPATPGKSITRYGGFLEGIELFDPQFFAVSPREAANMDPQQRLLLEVSWEALEYAGYAPDRLAGTLTGVFIGISSNDWSRIQFNDSACTNVYSGTGSALSIAANRLSYLLDLRGPSYAIDTACSSSLVAVHQACQSLRRGESDLALAGGVNLILSPEVTVAFSQTRMMAADGRCKTFDATADGYARAEGCGVIVLKRLSDALRDQDNIFALIRGSAVNQNGRSNGITAPNGPSQETVIRRAMDDAGVQPGRIGYIEAHGTGTSLGDPIEFNALKNVLLNGRKAEETCWIGSVKTNIGHLEAAAGIAGLIKIVLSMAHGIIPANLHLKKLNPLISLTNVALGIPVEEQTWRQTPENRLAGVSSFGFGGTNAHVVMQCAPEWQKRQVSNVDDKTSAVVKERPLHLLALSAMSRQALSALAGRYENDLVSGNGRSIGDICYTANTGRTHFSHRISMLAASKTELRQQLRDFIVGNKTQEPPRALIPRPKPRKTAFLFAGQGFRHMGMGHQLYRTQPTFRKTMQRCDDILRPYLEIPLLKVLFDDGRRNPEAAAALDRSNYVQPALFALEYALTEVWKSWGILPEVVMGHGLGEYVAACVAGVFRLEDGLKLVAERGRLVETLPRNGEMAAVFADEARVEEALAPYAHQASIAAVNGPEHIVISGTREVLHSITSNLHNGGVQTVDLNVRHAFHSPLITPVLERFLKSARQLSYFSPNIDIVSNVTGRLVTTEMDNPGYWGTHARETVRFAAGIETLCGLDCDVFIEIGPNSNLLGMARQCFPEQIAKKNDSETPDQAASDPERVSRTTEPLMLASLRRGRSEWRQLLQSLGMLYESGMSVDWAGFDRDYQRRRIVLPTYPFQRRRYWPTGELKRMARQKTGRSEHPLLGNRFPIARPAGGSVWICSIDPQETVFLKDHRIEGTVVFPAAGYTEMALAAAEKRLGPGPFEIRGAAFEKALAIDPQTGCELQTHVRLKPNGDLAFSIYSRPKKSKGIGNWVRHAAGRIRRPAEKETPMASATPEAIRRRLRHFVKVDEFYTHWSERGNHWGPAFQGIDNLWLGETEALAKIRVPAIIADRLDDHYIHPALLDACVQVMAAINSGDSLGAFVGRSVGSIRFEAPVRERVFWSHAILETGRDPSRQIRGDVRIMNNNGRLLGIIKGLEFEFLNMASATSQSPDQWLYRLRWQPAKDRGREVAPLPESWVIISDAAGVGESARRALKRYGQDVTLLSASDTASIESALDRENVHRVIKFLGMSPPEKQILSSKAFYKAHRKLNDVLALMRKLDQRPGSITPSLWIVTKGVWSIDGRQALFDPIYATLWGLGRTLALEHKRHWGGLVDLDPFADHDQCGVQLVEALLRLDGEDQVAIRNGRSYVARLDHLPLPDRSGKIRFREDSAYLITGGLGELGLQMARWLAAQGARRLILMGRSSLPLRSQWRAAQASDRDVQRIQAVLALEKMGVDVRIAKLDVSDELSFRQWLASYQAEYRPPIMGVIHAAGVLKAGLASELADEDLMTNLRPKVGGALVLERCLGSENLDFFVLFSSASATLSSPALGAYAAANAFLDALAGHRRARGLPGLSIAWGAWDRGGIATRRLAESSTLYTAMGLITPAQGLELAGCLWNSDQPHAAVLPADWNQFRQKYPEAAGLPLLTGIMERLDQTGGKKKTTAPIEPSDLLELTAGEQQSRLEKWLTGNVAGVLMLSADDVDPGQSLNTMGLDSLMALELRNRVESVLGVKLPIVDLIQGMSIRDVSSRLRELLTSEEQTGESGPTRHYANDQGWFPLSHGQQAQWLLHELAPESSAYHVAFAARIRSELDLDILQQSFETLIDRHASLRSTFTAESGMVKRHVGREIAPWFEAVDASAWDEKALKEETLKAYRQPFDLKSGAVVRMNVYQRSGRDHVLLLTIHHIACDGWSLWVLLDELRVLYAAAKTGSRESLEPLSLSYADFVHWQIDMLAGPEGQRLRRYWEKQLAGAPALLDLPTDRPRPPVQTYRGSTYAFKLSRPLSRKLDSLARNQGATLYMTLLAAFQVLLYRYSGCKDILVGSPFACRNHSESTRMVGYFVNPVVLRADFSRDPVFEAFLGQVRRTVLDAIAHQDYPFPMLVEQLQPERDPSYSPFFQVDFALQKPQQSAEVIDLMAVGGVDSRIDWGGLELEPFGLSQQEGQFDLSLEMADGQASLFGLFKYNTDLFDVDTIRRITENFRTLLKGIVEDPHRKVSQLPLIDTTQRRRIALEWNRTNADYPVDGSIHRIFEAQAGRNPEAVAVAFKGQRLSYGELNRRANQLAYYLQSVGVGPEVKVGICVERSITMVVAVMGVLKAGGVYVPLDPTYPEERLAFMLEDAGAHVLLTQSKLAGDLPGAGGSDVSGDEPLVVFLDTHWEAISRREESNPAAGVSAKNLAYVVYTSGSTGRPKGVMITHRSLINAYRAWEIEYELENSVSAHLQMANFSFDVFSGDLVRALCSGAKLVICPREWLLAPDKLYGLMRDENVDCAEFVPAVMRELVQYLEEIGQSLDFMRLMIVGSDVWSNLEYKKIRRLCGRQTRIINSYGVSEATIDSTWFEFSRSDNAVDGVVPIGRPFANTRIYILDPYLQPVPVGVAGELHIGGAGISRGYLNRPGLTAEKFVPDPFHTGDGLYLYKTGDLARYLPDGNVVFLGRMDNQVKIRGFRVELEEIEKALAGHPDVRETVAIAHESHNGVKSLVAYVVPRRKVPLTSSELYRFLKVKLPDFVVPSYFFMLKALPLTPNGKVDRRALPAPDGLRPQLEQACVIPRTGIERAIADVWCKLLELDEVGIHDNFFELGGHSLLMARMHKKLEEVTGRVLTVVELFQYPTIHALAMRLSRNERETTPLRPGGGRAEIRISLKASRRQQRQSRKKLRDDRPVKVSR